MIRNSFGGYYSPYRDYDGREFNNNLIGVYQHNQDHFIGPKYNPGLSVPSGFGSNVSWTV